MNYNSIISSWFNGYDFSLKRLRSTTYHKMLADLSAVAQHPLRSIGDFYSTLEVPADNSREIIAAPPALPEDYLGRPFLRPLRELQQYVRENFTAEEILGFYVHGSLSTRDYVEGYSDFDTLVILRRGPLDDPEWAADLKRRLAPSNTFLYLLDPLQHHHHFLMTEYDLDFYEEAIFPRVLFGYSSELSGFGNPISVRAGNSRFSVDKILETRLSNFTQFWPNMSMRGYDVKNAVQNIALLPALHIEKKRKSGVYKRESFDLARPDFSPELWSVVERASRVRETCPFASAYPYWLRKALGIRGHYKILSLVHQRLDRDNSRQMEAVMGPAYLADAARLVGAIQDWGRHA